MKRVFWFTLVFLLLGLAGHWWFEDWYGYLTSIGVFALRVGPLFLWRVVVRTIRRFVLRFVFALLPSFLKRPIRAFGNFLRGYLGEHMGILRELWKRSWRIRALILLPPLLVTCAIAYDADGVVEFIALFPVPFLVSAIFPQGFGGLMFGFLIRMLASHGLEGVIVRLTSLVPSSYREQYRSRRYEALRTIVARKQAAGRRTRGVFRLWRSRTEHLTDPGS